MKTALITGITGQDGSYLTELLLEKGYTVHGIIRRSSTFNTGRIDHLVNNPDIMNKSLILHYGDLTDSTNLNDIVRSVQPDEVYNLGAMSHVKVSFEIPEYSADANGIGCLRLLESIRQHCPTAKFYQASTSEMFGGQVSEMPMRGFNENSPFHPRSPYGVSKVYAYWISRNYRESYGMFTCQGILFNHESPRRGDTFVTKKITNWCKKYRDGITNEPLYLGNIDARRDWGHAKDFVMAQWLMLQRETPEDYVISTGVTNTVRFFVELCFQTMGKNIEWVGSGVDEVGICDGKVVIKISEKYFRPAEVDMLLGDSIKASRELGWVPKYNLKSLIEDMMDN